MITISTKHGKDFTSGNILPQIFMFAVPIFLTNVMQSLYNTADKVIVSRFAVIDGINVGKQALAAVGSTSHITNLLVNLFVGMATGTTIICAKALGAGDKEKVSKTLHTAVIFSLSLGALLAVGAWFFTRPLLVMMDTPEGILDWAVKYMRIYFLGMPFSLLYNFGAGILRSAGETRRPLIILAISGVLNVILNLLFVIVIPLGVAGVAIGTFASQLFSSIGVIFSFMHETGEMQFSVSKLRFNGKIALEIVKIGVPVGVSNIMYNIANVIFQMNLNSFGECYISGGTIATDINNYCTHVLGAFKVALISFVGQNHGARNYKRISKATLVSLGLCFSLVAVMICIIFPNMNFFLGIYTKDADVLETAAIKLRMMNLSLFVYVPDVIFVGAINGLGRTTLTAIINFICICLSRIVWILVVFKSNPTYEILLMCFPMSWGLSSAVSMIAYIVLISKYKRLSEIKFAERKKELEEKR